MQKHHPPEPPAGLAPVILKKIARDEMRMLNLKVLASLSLFFGSAYFVIKASAELFAELAHSGFFDLASLPISDFSYMLTNFPEYILSIAETFPFLAAAVVLAGVAVAAIAIASFVDEIVMLRARRGLTVR